jgi:DNA-binding transcriptional LysR family regulator
MGVKPTIALQASAPGAVVDLAARGLGVGILSESMAVVCPSDLSVLILDDIDSSAVLALIWTTRKSPALQELVRHSCAAFDQSPISGGLRPAALPSTKGA